MTKVGIEKRASIKIMLERSTQPFWRSAAMIPIGTPISTLAAKATAPSEIDTQMPLARMSLTLRP